MKTVYLPGRRTTLVSGAGDRSGEYHVRGGVCWPVPVMVETGQSAVGHAVLVGFELRARRYVVLADTEFVAVDPVVEPDGRVLYDGLAGWLCEGWSKWFARVYYYRQSEPVHKASLLAVLRSEMIKPTPGFIEVHDDDVGAAALFWRLVATKRLRFRSDAVVDQARRLRSSLGAPCLAAHPAIHALAAALAGMERWPWRDRTPAEPGV